MIILATNSDHDQIIVNVTFYVDVFVNTVQIMQSFLGYYCEQKYA